jgi:hypothetical protein
MLYIFRINPVDELKLDSVFSLKRTPHITINMLLCRHYCSEGNEGNEIQRNASRQRTNKRVLRLRAITGRRDY